VHRIRATLLPLGEALIEVLLLRLAAVRPDPMVAAGVRTPQPLYVHVHTDPSIAVTRWDAGGDVLRIQFQTLMVICVNHLIDRLRGGSVVGDHSRHCLLVPKIPGMIIHRGHGGVVMS
jgi:hypothetical protein